MNYCGQPFAHASNPLAVCGMIDPKRVYQCDQCAALSGQTCSHGQLKRVCRECELEAEIEALRAQVAALKGCVPELPEPLYAGNHLPRFGIRWNGPTEPLCVPMDDGYWTPWHYAKAKLADCQDVIRDRGHDADCPARACSFVGFASRCGQSPAWHKVVKVGHAYQSPPCSCGYSRCVEGGE